MTLEVVLITGMSGSGKSVALHALEDAGYYCVDNLPPQLLLPLVDFAVAQQADIGSRVGVAMDIRSASALPLVPEQLRQLRERGVLLRPIFLNATTGTLVRRFSETRRRHPLSRLANYGQAGPTAFQQRALVDVIELERKLLAPLREQAHVIDTGAIRPVQLRADIQALVAAAPSTLTLVFQSFAFKRGVPVDADYVFDVRMLPNPHYEPTLRELTGRDALVVEFLAQQPDVERMYADIFEFLGRWLEPLALDQRSYVTVAVGCTGGQHRSVYLVERLAAAFSERWTALKRHRELEPG